jgi:hypothetical protein
MSTITNLYIDQGTTFNSVVTLKNQDGTAMNLTGYAVASQFRKSYQSSVANNFTASIYGAPTNGQVRLQLTATASSAIKAGRYLYDIEITNTLNNEKFRVLEGIIILSPEITQT